MTTALKNRIIEWDGRKTRILETDPQTNIAWAIDLKGHKAMPFPLPLSEVLALRPITGQPGMPVTLAPHERTLMEKAWKCLQPLLQLCPDGQLFDPKLRKAAIERYAPSLGCSQSSLYKYLRRYWQRGQVQAALIPDFRNCGPTDDTDDENGPKPTTQLRGRRTEEGVRPYQITVVDLGYMKDIVEDRLHKDQRLKVPDVYVELLHKHYMFTDGIFHPSTGAYQIPTLHIELPADGANVKGLCISIIGEIDRRIPGSNYMKTYASGRLSEERLIHAAAHLMHLHLVGLLICDEVQNLANSKRGAQILMTQLVSLSNISRIPVLWIGTNKSVQVHGVDFRQARRSTGEGLAPWDRLHELGEVDEDGELTGKGSGEWEAFLAQLWQYQWLRKPVELEAEPTLAAYMYWASQGVIDVAIKFFSACQSRAMLDETEQLTLELMDTVYEEEFSVLHPLLEALRSNDIEALAKYDDIAPLDWSKHIEEVQAKIKARSSPMYKVKAGHGSFRARVVGSLTAGGVAPELANDAADYVAKQPGCTELVQAIKVAWEFVTLPKPARRNRKVIAGAKVKQAEELDPTRFDDRPGDYRQAFAHADADDVKKAQQMVAMGMAPQVEDLIEI